jgi:hypothetical protein
MKSRMFRMGPLALAALLLCAAGPAGAQIQVEVNRRPVAFTGAQPARVGGRVLIPLRAVVEALGAEVRWEAATQTVRGGRGERQFSLSIGSRSASVNGAPVTLDVPAQLMGGTTMVPLRFVAEALGAEVQWNAAAQQVVINDAGAAPPAAPDRIAGEVVAIRRDSLTLRTEDGRAAYDLAPDAVISRSTGGRVSRVGLDEVLVGDRVRLALDAQGRAARVEAFPAGEAPADDGRIRGEVVAVRSNARPPTIVVRSAAGRAAYEVTPDTLLFRSADQGRGVRVRLEEIEPGDEVTLRVDRTGAVAEVVDARAAADAVPLPEPARDIRITSFTHDAEGTLRGGSQVRVTLVGTPRGTATFDAGALAKDAVLREDAQRPGRYTGVITVPKGITAKEIPVVGQLRSGNRTAPLVQAAALLDVDSEPPAISDAAPADQARVRGLQPDIYAEISDGAGSGLDERSLRMTVRGKDVSEDVKVTRRFLLYTPQEELTPGAVPVTITIKDLAGNENRLAWSFTVERAPAAIQSVSHDGDRPLRAGDVLTVTVKAEPRGRGTFDVGAVARDLPLRETAAGVYEGRYTVRQGDQAVKAPVTVNFVTAGGDRVRHEATAPVNVVTQAARAPVISAPRDEVRLRDDLIVEGTAAPGSKVIVEVTYSGRAFGALPLKGTFGSQEVTADRDGRWTTEPFEVRLPLGVRRPELTISAVAVDAAGTESEPTTVTVSGR